MKKIDFRSKILVENFANFWFFSSVPVSFGFNLIVPEEKIKKFVDFGRQKIYRKLRFFEAISLKENEPTCIDRDMRDDRLRGGSVNFCKSREKNT